MNNHYNNRPSNELPLEVKEFFKKLFSKNKNFIKYSLLALFLLAGIYTGFYTVQLSEEAVVTRFVPREEM